MTPPVATSDQDILDAVRAAILAITSGNVAGYTLPTGQTVTRLDLDKLQRMEATYQARVQAAAAGAAFRPVQFGSSEGPL